MSHTISFRHVLEDLKYGAYQPLCYWSKGQATKRLRSFDTASLRMGSGSSYVALALVLKALS
jgi:hypothetical protein